MKYLNRFNERFQTGRGDIRLAKFRDNQLEKLKSNIEEFLYILRDVDLCASVSLTATQPTNTIMFITIDRKIDYPGTGIDSAYTEDSYGNLRRKWQTSLAFDDSYLEFIDRVYEICKEMGYVIFVKRATYFLNKETIRYYKFDKLIVATENRGSNHDRIQRDLLEGCIDVKDAIEIESKRSSPGFINKGLTWVGKKLNLI